MEWAQDGIVDVLQYDYINGREFLAWLSLGKQLDEWHVRSAPHHYGGHVGNYLCGHFAAIQGFALVEWDEASTPGIQSTSYAVVDGQVQFPNQPGFGLQLDEDFFQSALRGKRLERIAKPCVCRRDARFRVSTVGHKMLV